MDAVDVRAEIKFYDYPYTYESYWDEDVLVLGPLNGNTEWTYFETFVHVPNYLEYAAIEFGLDPPYISGYNYAYFDDIRFIEWEETWNPSLPLNLEVPSDIRYLGLRTASSQLSASMNISIGQYSATDSDNDGVPDCVEDCNGDGEVQLGETDPFTMDTDNDGLDDGEEFCFGEDEYITNGCKPDTDDDGYDDYLEFTHGTNPNDDLSHPSGPTATPSPTPYFSPSPTPTPIPAFTLTPTITPTVTPEPSLTPPPTTTPTTPPGQPTYTPIPPSPTPTPTSPPGVPTYTPILPTATPTSSSFPITINLELSSNTLRPDEICWVNLNVQNTGNHQLVDLYVLLDVLGSYWCFPSWNPMDSGLDHQTVSLAAGNQGRITILPEFTMPACSYAGPFQFSAVMLSQGTLDVDTMVANLDVSSFFIGE